MLSESPDLRSGDLFKAEITDINHEFLRLLTHPAVCASGDILGLDIQIRQALWELTPAELNRVAALPLLLPEFDPLPLYAGVRDTENRIADGCLARSWQEKKRDFANRLLACIWQNARANVWRTSLYAGISLRECRTLAEMKFSSLSRCSDQAARQLRVRLCAHDRYWPELIRAIKKGDPNQETASQLALIPLSVAQRFQKAEKNSGTGYI